jgi:putative transposase
MRNEFDAIPEVGRKTPAGGAHIFLGKPNIFFVTANAKDRVPWMNQREVQESLAGIWRHKATAWLVGYYLIMPDHVHFFCTPHNLHFDIDQWIAFWKSQFSRQHLALGQPWEWQRRAFHTRMRNRIQYEEQLTYVRENPQRKNLVQRAEEWPFQGRIHDIMWTGD